jgi:hypothetical protein
MSAAHCSRRWEVEAARDKRLSGSALIAHNAHLAACAECRAEQDTLEALARGLRASTGAAGVDEVALRRLRQTTLERAFELSRTPLRVPLRARNAVLAALAVLGVVVGVRVARHHRHHDAPALAVTAAGEGATWTRRSARDVEHVDLGEGAFSLVVRRQAHDARVIVHVPEGEIEDFGTTFDVRVHAGRTERVAVREGVVIFRRKGATPLRLSAGMVWSANQRAVAAEPAPEPSVSAAPRAENELLPVDVAPQARPAQPSPARTQRRVQVADKTQDARPRDSASDAARAAAAEDASYLRVLALLRESRLEEAKLAAAQYLRKFPNGFRRVELLRLAQAE